MLHDNTVLSQKQQRNSFLINVLEGKICMNEDLHLKIRTVDSNLLIYINILIQNYDKMSPEKHFIE